MTKLRDAEEIQRAHDLIASILGGDVPPMALPYGPHRSALKQISSVLCWVLEHDHNLAFGELLAHLETALAATGYALVRSN